MTLIFNQFDLDELHAQAPVTCPDNIILDEFEELTGVPEQLGWGYGREIELLPGVWLNFADLEYRQDLEVKVSAHEHPIQMTIFLSGFLDCDLHPTFDRTCSYFSGSGISPAYLERWRSPQRSTFVDIEIEPDVLESFFLNDRQRQSNAVKQLFKGEDWKVSFYPKVTPAMRSLALQMWNAPYRGAAKRMYLQGKVFELLAMHLDLISEDGARNQSVPSLKPEAIERLHYAKEILTTQFAHPLSLPELARQVGLTPRSLQRGFQTLFSMTVMCYLQQRRLEQAEQLLRQGDRTVAEVAMRVGYGHLGNFASAFKRRFGITPSQCLAGKRLIAAD
ncbi:helix-turn-helix transcriptional regulator [Scytonema millei]|uniref:Helix-turn-helix transcriptional regulator n=1 Tax=Scytonema millei VB511283 TaxID=1245923 RepID=A0A9X5I4L8_9CYAN|nr:AraC family transcriptional regulator [Scytonema millei]NHC34607.1 helix-turn-helix transcriptional regulator [Scytonema millei VB511283]